MKATEYIPDCGDAVWVTFTPQAGHEQAGRRPAIILSQRAYNDKVSLAVLCPITTQIKGYPFEVPVPAGVKVSGVVLSDQVKSLDWRARNTEFICKLPNSILSEVLGKLGALLNQQFGGI